MRQWVLHTWRTVNDAGRGDGVQWIMATPLLCWGVRALKVSVIHLEDRQQLRPRSLLCLPRELPLNRRPLGATLALRSPVKASQGARSC